MSDLTKVPLSTVPAGISESVDTVKILLWLLRGKKKILSISLLFAFIGLVISLLMKPVFTADTEILPPHGSMTQSLLNQMSGAVSMGTLGGMASALESKMAADIYVSMLGARPVEDDLIATFNLKDNYHTSSMMRARAALESSSKITATKDNLIDISVTDRDPKLAMQVANGYVDALRKLMHGLALSQASQRRIFYGEQLDKTKTDLAEAEVAFKQMEQSNHMISVDEQSKALINSSSTLRAQIAAKEVQLQGLRSYSTEANPQVQLAKSELAAMRSQQAQMDANSQGNYSDVGLSSVPEAQLSYVRATRELKYQENLYDLLSKQYEASVIEEAAQAPVIQVIEPAILPEHKSAPKRALIVLAAFFMGLVLGVLWALYSGWRKSLSPSQETVFEGVRKAAFRWSEYTDILKQ